MPSVPRIELGELYFKYKHHPKLIDVYVEGEFDRDVLRQLFRELKLSSMVSIFTANEVEIPNDALVRLSLRLESNKHRLVGLAKLIAQELNGAPANVTCLVDADQDRVLGVLETVRHLAYTRNTCLEMHCLSADSLHKFLVLGCNLQESAVAAFLQIANATLPVLFCLRAVNEHFGLAATMPPPSRGLTDRRDLASFDAQTYLSAFVASNNLHRERDRINLKYEEVVGALADDLRDRAHGHDFVELLFEFVAHEVRLRFQRASDITTFGGRLLMTAASRDELSADPAVSRVIAAAAVGGPFVWP